LQTLRRNRQAFQQRRAAELQALYVADTPQKQNPRNPAATPPPPRRQLARESVEGVLQQWSSLLERVGDKQRGELTRSMGLKMVRGRGRVVGRATRRAARGCGRGGSRSASQ
jgi:hypothetical protein